MPQGNTSQKYAGVTLMQTFCSTGDIQALAGLVNMTNLNLYECRKLKGRLVGEVGELT